MCTHHFGVRTELCQVLWIAVEIFDRACKLVSKMGPLSYGYGSASVGKSKRVVLLMCIGVRIGHKNSSHASSHDLSAHGCTRA